MYRLGPSLWVRDIDELMSAHVILNSSNKLGKSDSFRLVEHFMTFSQGLTSSRRYTITNTYFFYLPSSHKMLPSALYIM